MNRPAMNRPALQSDRDLIDRAEVKQRIEDSQTRMLTEIVNRSVASTKALSEAREEYLTLLAAQRVRIEDLEHPWRTRYRRVRAWMRRIATALTPSRRA